MMSNYIPISIALIGCFAIWLYFYSLNFELKRIKKDE